MAACDWLPLQDPRGFYVLNDIMRFLGSEEDEEEETEGGNTFAVDGVGHGEEAAERQPPAVVKHAVLAPGSANGVPAGREAPPGK